MNNLSILIVDDDLNKISAIIKTIREVHEGALNISQASNVYSAIESLQKKEFHLLISDLMMPLKYDDIPNKHGGETLIKSIYKKKTRANIPMYIVGLTQFVELSHSFKAIWNVWHFDASLEEWKINLRDLIFHISLVNSRIVSEKIETVFVEGPSDKKLIENAIDQFFPSLRSTIYIDTINYGGGASWVERQLFIWAKSLSKNDDSSYYLKAVGIFDDDDAGNNSINKLRKLITVESAESSTFSVLKNSYKYSPLLKSIRAKGICFPTTAEDLFSINCWNFAKEQNWLQNRNLNCLNVEIDNLKLDPTKINKEILLSHNFSEDEILITLYKVKDEHKLSFCKYICSLAENEKKPAFQNFSYLLQDIFKKLNRKILTP
jgi:CheY-like chemotaxis protein